MSATENILRVQNVQGVVTSIVDRGQGPQLINQYYDASSDSPFDLSANRQYEQLTGKRPIQSIPLDVAIRYTPEMSSVITSNPVQQGVNVNDHIYNNPDTLVVNFGTSDVKGTLARMTGLIATVQNLFDNIKNNQTPSRILLALLYKAKEERTVFKIDDGLRTYTDMVIQNITYDKDKSTYRSLVATITLQQLIYVRVTTDAESSGLVRTQVTTVDKSTFATLQGYIDRIKLI